MGVERPSGLINPDRTWHFAEAYDEFSGRERDLLQLHEYINRYGHAAICGGQRIGKSSLALAYVREHVGQEQFDEHHGLLFEPHSLNHKTTRIPQYLISSKEKTYLIVDEAPSECQECASIVESITGDKTLTPVFVFVGDPSIYDGLTPSQDQLYQHFANDCSVTPKLLTDDEMAKLIDKRKMVSPWLRDLIVQYSGGHLSLAGAYADAAINMHNVVDTLPIDQLMMRLDGFSQFSKMYEQLIGVNLWISKLAGFNLSTWQNTKYPNIHSEIYQQSLPDARATYFWKWANQYSKTIKVT